jgi:hypothetical protein
MHSMTYDPCWRPGWYWLVLNELDVDSTSASAAAFTGVGGAADVSVEYLVDQGAAGPAVTVNMITGSSTTTWTATSVTPGFHAHRFGSLPQGVKLTLSATDAMARLRWCEPVCCQ